MQSASGPGTTIVHLSPKNHTILQQSGQHVLLSKIAPDSISSRPSASGVETSLLQTAHSNNSQTIYPAHYIEAITEQSVYAANGEGGQYQEYTPIIYAPVSGGQAYYQTANGQLLATSFGTANAAGHTLGALHTAAATAHANLTGGGHAQLVTHQGATYLVQGGQLDDDGSALSHTAKASPVTVQWLVDNYETAESVSLPRSTLYFHYLQHCNEHKLEPMNPASFGKLIRSVFYGLRTRRLGTRGNSKYHYYGIRIKPNSPLNHFIEDAGFSLRHYPNYHRQTMEAAAEWKSFTNSSLNNRLKSLSTISGNGVNSGGSISGSTTIGLNNLTSHSNNVHSTSSHVNNSHYGTTTFRSDKSLMNNSYSNTGNVSLNSATSQSASDNTTSNSITSPALSSSGAQHHAHFLGEASSALPNLDEICRSSGLPVPSEVDLAENSSNKNRSKVDSSANLSINEDVVTFCRLYALSAGYMLDAVVNLDFTSIETVWKAFWCTEEVRDSRLKQSLSQERLYSLVSDPAILQFVRLYDHTFYQSLAEVLIPNVLRPIPPTLTQAIRNFAKSLEGWMRQATQGLDTSLVNLKVSAVSALAQTLRRYTSLNHLAQAARAVLKNANQINQMLADLNRVDFYNVQEQASWVCQCSDFTVSQLERDFKRILQKHASLEEWAQWLDTVVTSVLQPLEGNSLAYTRAAHQLVLKWSFYSSMVIRDLTLRSASSFGSFHLIRLLYDEYIFYLVEHKVAAHLGMTPVAVMGEMGRNITQLHCGQNRLRLDNRDTTTLKSSKSVHHTVDELKLSNTSSGDPLKCDDSQYSPLNKNNGVDHTNSKFHHNNNDIENNDSDDPMDNADDREKPAGDHHVVDARDDNFDEEVDEYLDDEDEVDDSLGDENAMLKEAHATAQAYCRSSSTINPNAVVLKRNCYDAEEITVGVSGKDEKLEKQPDIHDIVVEEHHSENTNDIDEADDGKTCNKSKLVEKFNQKHGNLCQKINSLSSATPVELTKEKTSATSTAMTTTTATRSCSPPSIVTMPNPVRKVVRVTTFCDAKQQQQQQSITESSYANSSTSYTTTATTRSSVSVKQSSSSVLSTSSTIPTPIIINSKPIEIHSLNDTSVIATTISGSTTTKLTITATTTADTINPKRSKLA
ncbi:Transcription factor RFX3 [Schistosoma japonicum]|uniref:Transcription factor RFX3 n=1 Tax=Schistosoma japonicum TaxID=6182 RepID=A0A4Z2D209_SCHJA|nr:Transcription factor RFX3 [Schistosoma japonicum]